ncbi:hypothetical protein MYX82_05845 [Acidobacteria bacterium AH-259-D05]|nr:hypothetical protein [Acidobacteria bacterium AH-259-D05]
MKAYLIPVFFYLLFLGGAEPPLAQRPTMPGGYQLPDYLQPITLRPVFRPEPLLQAARKVISDVAFVQAGEKVLILSDSSINPLLPQVFEQAALEKQAQVHVYSLPLPNAADAEALLREQHWRNWWPPETWNQVRTADAVVALAYLNPEFLKEPLISGQIESGQLRFVSVTAVPELLAAPGAYYPSEIIDLLAEKISVPLRRAKTVRITDPAGTDLTFTPGPVASSPGSGSLSFPYNATVEVAAGADARGSLVSHTITTGFVPLLKMAVEEARIVSVQGGGEVGELLKLRNQESFQLQKVAWSLHPRSVRLQKRLTGSAAIHNQLAGIGRAGAMRLGFWGEDSSRSFFFQVYFPTVWADGEEIIRQGYPLALGDPEVLRLAESLGGRELLVVQCTVLPGTLPEPKIPQLQPIKRVDSLLPALEILVKNVAKIHGHEQVLIVTDDSVPDLVLDGLQVALAESGPQVRTMRVEVPEAEREPLALLEQAVGRKLSAELKQAVAEADCVLSPAYFHLSELLVEGEELDTWLEKVHTRWVSLVAIPELLATKWATYPPQLLELIGKKVEEELLKEKTVILSNNQGTSLIYDYQLVRAVSGTHWSIFPTSIRYRLVPQDDDGVEGIIVTSNLWTGRVPRTEVHLGAGEVVQVAGSARTRQAVTQATAQGGFLELSFGVNPKVIVPGEVDGFSPRMWSHYAASQRSGVVSVLLGSRSQRGERLPFTQFFSLVNAGGPRIIIDLGHLTALDDEEVQQLAEQLGSVEDLLEEEWIPAIGER